MNFRVDDVDIHVDGNGPETIVMVHGWPDTYRLWDSTVAGLKDRYRCVRFTLPGYDRAHRQGARTLPELIAFIGRVVDAVSPDRAVTLMLHDWGCVFGYQYYVRHRARVARIVGVDIGDSHSMRQEAGIGVLLAVLAYQWTLALAFKLGGRIGDRITHWMARKLHCPSDPALMHAGMDYPYYVLWFGGAGSFRGIIAPFEPEVPYLYIYAKKKPFQFHARSWVERMQARPGNRVEGFDTNHWVMIQQPERFNQVVGDWLAAARSA